MHNTKMWIEINVDTQENAGITETQKKDRVQKPKVDNTENSKSQNELKIKKKRGNNLSQQKSLIS